MLALGGAEARRTTGGVPCCEAVPLAAEYGGGASNSEGYALTDRGAAKLPAGAVEGSNEGSEGLYGVCERAFGQEPGSILFRFIYDLQPHNCTQRTPGALSRTGTARGSPPTPPKQKHLSESSGRFLPKAYFGETGLADLEIGGIGAREELSERHELYNVALGESPVRAETLLISVEFVHCYESSRMSKHD